MSTKINGKTPQANSQRKSLVSVTAVRGASYTETGSRGVTRGAAYHRLCTQDSVQDEYTCT